MDCPSPNFLMLRSRGGGKDILEIPKASIILPCQDFKNCRVNHCHDGTSTGKFELLANSYSSFGERCSFD